MGLLLEGVGLEILGAGEGVADAGAGTRIKEVASAEVVAIRIQEVITAIEELVNIVEDTKEAETFTEVVVVVIMG